MVNYQIVKDEEKLKEFIEWLPDLKPTEKYYMCLFARNKYCKELTHIKSDKAQLKRFVTDKERMFQKIKQLEIEEGWYMQKHIPVPQKALALYITPNPREMYKAAVNTMVKLATAMRDQNMLMNVHQEALSEIQRSKSRTCWIDFDIDIIDEKHYGAATRAISSEINLDAVQWLKTRGGLHCLIDPSKVEDKYKKSFYQKISAQADQTGDNMIPVPGCTQGDFVPHFITI